MTQRTVLAAAVLAALSSGTNYAFSAFGPQLGDRLHLSSKVLNLVAASGNAGVYLSGPALGVLCDRAGPQSALSIAAITLFLGYVTLRLLYNGGQDGAFASFGVGGLICAEVLIGVGSSAGLSGAINGVSRSFSIQHRGAAMSTVIAGFGLSAFLYSTLSHALSSDDPTSSFLLCLAIGCGVSMVLGVVFVKPLLHPITTAHSPVEAGYARVAATDAPETSPSNRRELEHASWQVSKEREVNVSGRVLLVDPDFHYMFAFLGLCSGIGLMYLNNIGTIAVTLADTDDLAQTRATQNYLVSLLSLANCAGRLAAGFASDWTTHRCPHYLRMYRIRWYIPIASLFILSQVAGASANAVSGWRGLTTPTVLTGFAYGALFAVSPVVCLERFGLTSFSTNNGLLTLSPSVYGNIANVGFGVLYDSNVDWSEHDHEGPATSHICKLGPACFSSAFMLTIAMSCSALLVAVMLGRRMSMTGI